MCEGHPLGQLLNTDCLAVSIRLLGSLRITSPWKIGCNLPLDEVNVRLAASK